MPQPVKLSDSLIEAAREAAPAAHRSLAAQVEHWATLGRAIEGSLTSEESAILKGHAVREPMARPYVPTTTANPAHILVAALERTMGPGFAAQVRASLDKQQGPKYGPHPDYPGYLVQRNADGTLTPGRMVKRKFVPAKDAARKRTSR